MKDFNLNKIIKNIVYFIKFNYRKELLELKEELNILDKEIRSLKLDLLYLKLMSYFETHSSKEYEKEINYLKKIGYITIFPYERIKSLPEIKATFDPEYKLPYILHESNKKLYFPKKYNLEQTKEKYRDYYENENILGGGFTEKAPHQYQSDNVRVKKNDIVLDIGSAEAIFSLSIIDEAKKVYIFEMDNDWIEPLQATFKPYKDKVTIVNKKVSNVNSDCEIRLDTLLLSEPEQGLFIKIDIEGSEYEVIKENESLLKSNFDIRISCCTYHKQDDAGLIEKILIENGFQIEYSDGYMLFIYDDNIKPPYFRKGIIRAFKTK